LNFRKLFILITVLLFGGIFIASKLKKAPETQAQIVKVETVSPKIHAPLSSTAEVLVKEDVRPRVELVSQEERPKREIERIRRFFSKGMDKLPIVETITYSSRVSWLKGRPAWIADYASHFQTSRHFIARSLNGKVDYFTQNVTPGDKFNVFKLDKDIQFYFIVDLSTCTMDFYYLDLTENERVYLKTYSVGAGRLEPNSPSGSLTPLGKFMLGNRIAVYKPGIEHFFQNRKTHMIEVFGTRWLPFEQELENCTDSAKGYGLHGVPCRYDAEKNLLIEEENGVGCYNSDGCLRLRMSDIEEIFSIVVTKPTIVEIVKNKNDVVLPMQKENFLGDDR
jgi:hypothetical protein